MPESHVNFVYKLDGNIAEIDVFQLAPTLLSLGELIQEANREINPYGRQIGVNVKPFRNGSFIVDLTAFPQNNLQQVLDLLSSQPVEQFKNVLEWVGLIGGGNFGVVQLVKWLKGRPKSVEDIGPGEVRYTAGDDKSITVKSQVRQLFSNSNITNHIYQVYAAPMEGLPSVTDIKTYIEGEEGSEVMVSRDEVYSLRETVSPSPLPTEALETVKETVHRGVFLNPKRGAFGDDGKDWSFYRGGDVITATVKDKTFLASIHSGVIRLNQSDLLTVDLVERQKVKGTVVQKPVYEISSVTNYVKGQDSSLPLEATHS